MTAHAEALRELESWAAPTEEQARLRERYVAHLTAHQDGLERACFPDHLTAGTLVLSPGLDAVLLNLHRKARRWFHFGGHWEPGDASLAATALREAHEESGLAELDFDDLPLQLSSHDVPFCDPRGVVCHLDVRYVAVAAGRAGEQTSAESLEVRWWPLDGLPDDLEDDMRELVWLAVARARPGWSAQSPVASSRAPIE